MSEERRRNASSNFSDYLFTRPSIFINIQNKSLDLSSSIFLGGLSYDVPIIFFPSPDSGVHTARRWRHISRVLGIPPNFSSTLYIYIYIFYRLHLRRAESCVRHKLLFSSSFAKRLRSNRIDGNFVVSSDLPPPTKSNFFLFETFSSLRVCVYHQYSRIHQRVYYIIEKEGEERSDRTDTHWWWEWFHDVCCCYEI